MEHPADIYNVTFESDNVTIKCYVYDIIIEGSPSINVVNCETLLGTTLSPSHIQNRNRVNKTMTVVGRASTMLTIEDLQYRYFQYSNLSAWKVWYCLDNDKSRFAWADDSVDEGNPASIMGNTSTTTTYTRNLQNDTEYENVQYYAWEDTDNNPIYTTRETPQIGDSIYGEGKGGVIEDLFMNVSQFTPAQEGTGLPNGRGVIYRLIDEFNNDVCYDFKNIQYIRPLDANGEYDPDNGTDTYVYTFNGWDGDNSIIIDYSLAFEDANNNKITVPFPDNFVLPDVVSVTPMIFSSSSSGSSNSTISGSNNKLEGCEELVVIADKSTFINCSGGTIGDGTQDPAIYINNTKVLTEK